MFNTAGSKLYAMNLEGMSIYEFDQPTRKISREFEFKPTKIWKHTVTGRILHSESRQERETKNVRTNTTRTHVEMHLATVAE